MKNLTASRCTMRIMRQKWPIFDDFGSKSAVVQEPFQTKSATSIIAARVPDRPKPSPQRKTSVHNHSAHTDTMHNPICFTVSEACSYDRGTRKACSSFSFFSFWLKNCFLNRGGCLALTSKSSEFRPLFCCCCKIVSEFHLFFFVLHVFSFVCLRT